jgi:hypothetical protein
LGTRIPLLAVADDDGEVARMLRAVGGCHLVTRHDAAAIAEALESILREPGSLVGPRDDDLLNEWSSRTQMAQLVAALEGWGDGVAG